MKKLLVISSLVLLFFGCKKEPKLDDCNQFDSAYALLDNDNDGLTNCEESTGTDNPNTTRIPNGVTDTEVYTPHELALTIPETFNLILPPLVPNSNSQTEEGVALGRKLFYDEILSADGTQSCASCHKQANAFTDDVQFSIGIDGISGNRNSMPLFNVAWNFDERFFWNGRSFNLENQALEPVENPIEMHDTWPNVVSKLENTSDYPDLFLHAFGTNEITKENVAKALAQFERTLISGNAKFDQYINGNSALTPDELEGFNIFMDEARGDCFHCHGSNNNPLWTDNKFHNNGLNLTPEDVGLEFTTGEATDRGKFKSPSLRNLAYTAPYMHDGRFATLEEVINHYSEGLVFSPTIDPLMKNVDNGGVQLTDMEKQQLLAFLLTLGDESFITNPSFSDPN